MMDHELLELLDDLDAELDAVEEWAGPMEGDPDHYNRLRGRIAMAEKVLSGRACDA